MEAVVPCAVVEGRAEVITKHFEQLFDEILQQTTSSGNEFYPMN